MITDSQEKIRPHLASFIGALISASDLEDISYRKQSVLAVTTEEVVKICADSENGTIDMIASKPILKAAAYVLKKRMTDVIKTLRENSISEKQIEEKTQELNNIIKALEQYINKIK